ncbi:hypothetical protein D3C87_1432530 [compost metagenome]
MAGARRGAGAACVPDDIDLLLRLADAPQLGLERHGVQAIWTLEEEQHVEGGVRHGRFWRQLRKERGVADYCRSAGSAGPGIGNLAGGTLATVLGEIAEQAVHSGKIGAVDQVAALLLDSDESGVRQFLQMEGERVSRHAKLIGQDAGGQAGKSGNHQGAEHAQALGMGQGIEGGDGLIFIHDSIIQRLLNH